MQIRIIIPLPQLKLFILINLVFLQILIILAKRLNSILDLNDLPCLRVFKLALPRLIVRVHLQELGLQLVQARLHKHIHGAHDFLRPRYLFR